MDLEVVMLYFLLVIVIDGDLNFFKLLVVNIIVKLCDDNDNVLMFSFVLYSVIIIEDMVVFINILNLICVDVDFGMNG